MNKTTPRQAVEEVIGQAFIVFLVMLLPLLALSHRIEQVEKQNALLQAQLQDNQSEIINILCETEVFNRGVCDNYFNNHN